MNEEELTFHAQLSQLKRESEELTALAKHSGWKLLCTYILMDVSRQLAENRRQFLRTEFAGRSLDGIQSAVFDGYLKGVVAGLERVTELPERILAKIDDEIALLQRKVDEIEQAEKANGSSTSSGAVGPLDTSPFAAGDPDLNGDNFRTSP